MQTVFKVIILLFFCLPSLSLDLEEYLKNLTFVHVQRVVDRSENEIEINAELQMRKYLLSGKRVSQISVDNKEKILEYGARKRGLSEEIFIPASSFGFGIRTLLIICIHMAPSTMKTAHTVNPQRFSF